LARTFSTIPHRSLGSTIASTGTFFRRLKANADQFAGNVLPVIESIQRSGVTSHNAIAQEINSPNVKTPCGGTWTHVQVGAIINRS